MSKTDIEKEKGFFSIRLGSTQPCYISWYTARRVTLDELYAHEDIGETPFLNRWFWGYWVPRVRVSFKNITKLSIKWLVFGFAIDKY